MEWHSSMFPVSCEGIVPIIPDAESLNTLDHGSVSPATGQRLYFTVLANLREFLGETLRA